MPRFFTRATASPTDLAGKSSRQRSKVTLRDLILLFRGRRGSGQSGDVQAETSQPETSGGPQFTEIPSPAAVENTPASDGGDIRRLPLAQQRRLDRLMTKNSKGKLTAAERAELEGLVRVTEELALENAKRLRGRA